jgi:DNA-binding response OmpR family regulator
MSKRILVVDDDPVTLAHCKAILGSAAEKYEVILSGDPVDALKKLAEDAMDLVITDILMPKFNGNSLLTAVRSVSSLNVPVMMISGKRDEKTIANALDLGAADYICKPIDPDLFLTKVRSILFAGLAATKEHFATVPIEFDVDLEMTRLSAFAVDVSEAGMTLHSKVPLPANLVIQMRSSLFSEIGIKPPRLRVSGWIPAEMDPRFPYRISASFVGLDEEELRTIRRWVFSRSASNLKRA